MSVQSHEDEESKKSIFYENLRLRNRENYEVMLNQKPDTVIKAPSEKEPERPKKPGTLLLPSVCARSAISGKTSCFLLSSITFQ